MSAYSISHWVLFFFWYCFLGWIWESCYVTTYTSYRNKKLVFVNRGFLHGPLIPIYGFAAISILVATLPVKQNIMAVYLFGMLAATGMELVTGTTMERLFKVKYWDYSDLPLNYHGHICLFVSMFWGLFAILMVEVIHVPVEYILLKCPQKLCDIAALVLTVFATRDFSESFQEAMDMRELLEKITENNQTLQKLEKRVDATIAFRTRPALEAVRERRRAARETILMNLEELRESKQFKRAVKLLRRNPSTISNYYKEALEEIRNLIES